MPIYAVPFNDGGINLTAELLQDAGVLDVDQSRPAEAIRPESGADVLALMLDQLTHGALLINAKRRILYANQVARCELDKAAVISSEMGELTFVSSADTLSYEAAMEKAIAGERSLIKLAYERGSQADAAVVTMVPLDHRAGISGKRIALFLSRASVCESGAFKVFASAFGLTQTEEQVLSFLCRGLSTPEIASRMKIAVSTVRSHVRNACIKTASRGVRELVHKIATLPPVAPLLFGNFY